MKKPRKTPLNYLLPSRVRIQVLGLLISNSDKNFHLRDIARRIGSGATSVKKELENLKKLNLISESKKGNPNLFQIRNRE